MKCNNCNFENRDGVNFCENCGERMQPEQGRFCSNCGHQNRPEVNFCEECGKPLGTAASTAPISATPGAPPVVVQESPKKRRRVRAVWLLMILLLLLVTCCLLLYQQIPLPDGIRPWMDPVINRVRKALPLPGMPGGMENGQGVDKPGPAGQKPATCEEFRAELDAANLGAETNCYNQREECYTDIYNIGFFDGLRVDFKWDGGARQQSTCEQMTGFFRCYFPRKRNADRVDYWIMLDNCEEKMGFSDGWLEEAPVEVVEVPKAPEQRQVCCPSIDSEPPIYFRNPPPNGPLFLGFGLECEDGGWQFEPGTCAEFDAYVGAKGDQYWASGECCPDGESPENWLICEALLEDQKKSRTRIDLHYGECSWGFEFQSPYYAPKEESTSSECPEGESMCAGSCCSIGHCCDCEGVFLCLNNCSDCY